MFLIKHFSKRLMRDGTKSLSVPLLAFVLVVLINLLGGVRQQLEAEYLDVIENFQIIAQLSDHTGQNTDELNIRDGIIDVFANAENPLSLYAYTSDLSLRREIMIVDIAGLETSEETHEDGDDMMLGRLIGITDVGVLHPGAETASFNITFFDGYDESIFRTQEHVFVIDERLLPYTYGNTLNLSFRSNNPNVVVADWIDTIDTSLSIVGTIAGDESNLILGPFWAVSELAEESDNHAAYTELLHMTVADNRELSGLKDMASHNFTKVNPVFTILPFSMTIFDSEFFETLEPLRQNIILVDVATPFIYVISIAVGFLTCILLTRRRMSEYAIMRSVGVHRRGIFIVALGEQAVLSTIGAALGLALVALTWGYLSFTRPAVFLACYVLGAVFSAARAAGTDVMAILRNKE